MSPYKWTFNTNENVLSMYNDQDDFETLFCSFLTFVIYISGKSLSYKLILCNMIRELCHQWWKLKKRYTCISMSNCFSPYVMYETQIQVSYWNNSYIKIIQSEHCIYITCTSILIGCHSSMSTNFVLTCPYSRE